MENNNYIKKISVKSVPTGEKFEISSEKCVGKSPKNLQYFAALSGTNLSCIQFY